MKKSLTVVFAALLSLTTSAQSVDNVLSTARLANTYFKAKYADPTYPTFVNKERPSSLWTRAVYYEGLTAYMDILPSGKEKEDNMDYVMKWASFHKFSPRNGVNTTDADDQCCGQTYFWIYENACKKDRPQYAVNIFQNLDSQIVTGRHDYWTWIDAIQMAMPLYAMAYKASGDRKYLDFAMECYRWSRNTCAGGLFNPSKGLWYRDKDYAAPYKEPDGVDCYWSRGNGWVYAALVRVMDIIGPRDKYYPELKADFQAMSAALITCQREDGLWNPSLISSNYAGKELTGSALFLYGMSWGIRKGLINAAQYRRICDKTWKGIESCVHADGFLGFVQGTGKDPSAGQPLSYDKTPDFEDYGTGCFLLCAAEYSKLFQ